MKFSKLKFAFDPKKDYYHVLGVDKNASNSELKKAYYRLAQKHHPDKKGQSPDAVSKFQAISDAYAIIGDQENRDEYDEAREEFLESLREQESILHE